MSSTVSISLRTQLLRGYFTPDYFTPAAALYVAVSQTVALANSPGNVLDEPAAAAYARSPVQLTSDFWTVTEAGEVVNIVDLDFPPPTTGEDWGYLSGWELLDAPTGGMCQAVGALINPLVFTSDLPYLSIPPGGIVVGLYD